MAYIKKIGLENAPFHHKQSAIKKFAIEQYDIPEKYAQRVDRMYDNSLIDSRYSAIADFSFQSCKTGLLLNKEPATTAERMEVYFEVAPKLCEAAILKILSTDQLQTITHLITVSCTGIAAPGLDIILLEQLDLPNNISRHSINFMGCYAGFHAMKTAKAICADQANAQVLIVDVELCTLHFQRNFTMDNVASTLLFADGAAAILINNEEENSLYKLDSFYTEVALQGKKDMAWHIGEQGFMMTLSSYIPTLVGENILPLLNNAIKDKNEIDYWAIHPGGKKILQEIAKGLDLKDDDLNVSYEILRQFGNMSSVTIFYVLEAMHKTIKTKGKKIFGAGFGPGLTIESGVFISC